MDLGGGGGPVGLKKTRAVGSKLWGSGVNVIHRGRAGSLIS